MPRKANGRHSAYRINVGDHVCYPTIGGRWEGEVIEDRGHLGVGGRRILQIRTFDEYEEARIEMAVPEDELELME